jgi:large conductance mechanosensitive channel
MFKEFKEFALKGNLIDMAVAFVMGAAFTKLSGSFIEDLIMPVVGKLTGGMDFSNNFIALADTVNATNLLDAKKQGAVLAYGNFITVSLNFVIVTFVMFLVVKAINRAKQRAAKAPEPEVPPASVEAALLAEIRDLLQQKK